MRDIGNAIPHLDDEEMVDLSLQVVDKLKAMSDEEFAMLEIEGTYTLSVSGILVLTLMVSCESSRLKSTSFVCCI